MNRAELTRRAFFARTFAAGAGAALAGLPRLAAAGTDGGAYGAVKARFGVTSDTHIKLTADTYEKRNHLKRLERTLTWFRDANVDGVVVAGDLTDVGTVEELQNWMSVWKAVYPENRNAAGGHVEKLIVTGNHDDNGWSWMGEENKPDKLRARGFHVFKDDPAKFWPEVFGEPWQPVWTKTVKGFTFVGANWHATGSAAKAIKAAGASVPTDQPFFYIQHAPQADTLQNGVAWGIWDDHGSRAALALFPNAVSLTGHSHHPLTDETSVWQGEYTAINTASLSFLAPRWGRDNASYGNKSPLTPLTPSHSLWGAHAQVMTVYEKAIVLERRDMERDEVLDENWVIPLPCAADRPFTPSRRASVVAAPEFPPESKLTVEDAVGKVRSGPDRRRLAVSVPVASADAAHGRVFDYEVQIQFLTRELALPLTTKRVEDDWLAFSRERMREKTEGQNKTVSCLFEVGPLPKKVPLRVKATPLNALGRAGAPIYSDTFTVEEESA